MQLHTCTTTWLRSFVHDVCQVPQGAIDVSWMRIGRRPCLGSRPRCPLRARRPADLDTGSRGLCGIKHYALNLASEEYTYGLDWVRARPPTANCRPAWARAGPMVACAAAGLRPWVVGLICYQGNNLAAPARKRHHPDHISALS